MGGEWLGPSFGAGPGSKTSEGTKLNSEVGSKVGSNFSQTRGQIPS